MIWILIIGVLCEALWDHRLIALNLSTRPNEWIRLLTGAGMFTYFFFVYQVGYEPYYEYLIAVSCLAFFGYSFLFNSVLNVMRGKPLLYIGQTKKWDRFWRGGWTTNGWLKGATVLVYYLTQWSGFLIPLVYLYL